MKKIYEADNFMIRYPHFSFSDGIPYENESDFLIAVKKDKEFMEQIFVASKSTYDMIKTYDIESVKNMNEKAQRNLFETIYKYWNRSRTRTTPFGLFSKVNIGKFDKTREITLIKKSKKIISIDTKWLLKFIKILNEEFKEDLLYKLNEANYVLGNRVYLLYCLDDENVERLNIKLTKVFELISDTCKDRFCSLNFIFNMLITEYGEDYRDSITEYLDTLIDNKFLISNLSISLLNNCPLEIIRNVLSTIKSAKKYIDKIDCIISSMEEYSKSDLGEGTEKLVEIIEMMKSITESNHYVQIDYFGLDNIKLDNEVKNEIEKFASFIMYISSNERYNYIHKYRDEFIEKYGVSQEISITELFDKGVGIGAPDGYINPKNDIIKHFPSMSVTENEEKILLSLYENALINRTDIDVSKLELEDYDNFKISNATDSIELYFTLQSLNGKIVPYLSGVIGSKNAGLSFGRFANVEESIANYLIELNKREKAYYNEDNYEFCEITLLSEKSNHSNVMRTINTYDKEMALYVSNSKNSANRIYLSDVLVGIEKNKFYFKNKKTKKNIIFKMTNMYNLEMISNELRFLIEASDSSYSWQQFSWNNVYRKFSYIPKIKYKNIVISTKQWKLSLKEIGNIDKMPDEKLKICLFNYLKQYKIPTMFYIVEQDNKILINTDNNFDILILLSEIKKNYRKFKFNMPILIKEVEDGVDIVNDNLGNRYKAEIVVPLFKKMENKYITEYSLCNYERIPLSKRISLPFDNSLYYKIYIKKERHNEFIINNLLSLVGSNQYFYMRYEDPYPHIRLRIFAEQEELLSQHFKNIEIIKKMQNSALISNIQIDSYDREIERYGGIELLKIIEHLFYVDSEVIRCILTLEKKQDISLKIDDLAVISNYFYIKSFWVDFDEMLQFFDFVGISSVSPKSPFKNNKMLYIDVLNNISDNISVLEKAFNNRNDIINKILMYFDKNEIDTITKYKIIDSIIHLSSNRILGIQRTKEKHILEIIRTIILYFRYTT